jgi:hypothetical protein
MKIQIFSPDTNTDNPQITHDYWVKHDIIKAIKDLGHNVIHSDSLEIPDIQIVLWGQEPHYKIKTEGKFRAIWLFSRPNKLPRLVKRLEQQVYTLTKTHQRRVRRKGIESKVLAIASNKEYRPVTRSYVYDIAYMGFCRGHCCTKIEKIAEQGYKIVIAGPLWEKMAQKHPNIHLMGNSWPNDNFSNFFNLAPLSVYPVRDVYLKYGIVPIRIFDIFRSSDCLCITSKNEALKEVFSTLPPTYNTEDELLDHIRFYLKRNKIRHEKQQAIRSSLVRTYREWLLDIINDAMSFLQEHIND